MRARVLSILAVAFAIVGLGASIASLIDYLGETPTFCSHDGCETVRQSAWAHPLGIPLPAIGIAYFVMMLVLAVVERRQLRIALAALGGAAGIGLISLQAFAIGAWCTLCLIVDPVTIAHAIAVIAGARALQPNAKRIAIGVVGTATVVLGLGAIVGAGRPEVPTNVPDNIVALQRRGVVTIVEFVDFQCPFCRALDKQLSPALAATKHPVQIIRKMVPLPSHSQAIPAAMAWVAADAQGLGDVMAKELFARPPAELGLETFETIVREHGGNAETFTATLKSEPTRTHIEHDIAEAQSAGVEGLPTIFIGRERFSGAEHSTAELSRAIDRAWRASSR